MNAHFPALAADWQNGLWQPDLPDRALALARRAPRLQNRLLAIDIAHVLRCDDAHALASLRSQLAMQREPHPRLLLRTAAIALELGDRAQALEDLDQAFRLERGSLRARLSARISGQLSSRIPYGSLWTLSACPALLALVLAERPERLLPSEIALAERATNLMDRLHSAHDLIEAQLSAASPVLPDSISRLKTGRTRVAVVDARLPIDPATPRHQTTGTRTDAAELVVRFDDTRISPAECRQRGMRTDLWVLSSARLPTIDEPAGNCILVAEPSFGYRPHAGWADIEAAGISGIAGMDRTVYRDLTKTLRTRPSAALATLVQLTASQRPLQIELVDDGMALMIDVAGLVTASEPSATEVDSAIAIDPERALMSSLLRRSAS